MIGATDNVVHRTLQSSRRRRCRCAPARRLAIGFHGRGVQGGLTMDEVTRSGGQLGRTTVNRRRLVTGAAAAIAAPAVIRSAKAQPIIAKGSLAWKLQEASPEAIAPIELPRF